MNDLATVLITTRPRTGTCCATSGVRRQRAPAPTTAPGQLLIGATAEPDSAIQSSTQPFGPSREKRLDDVRAAIETSARECLRQRLRFTGEEAAFIPFNDRTRRTIGRSIKERRKTGKVSSH